MITTGKTIFTILSTNAAIITLVGTKIFPLVVPEDTLLPCIVYERSFDNQYTKDGLASSDSTINITVISENYKKSIDISEAVFNALNMYRGSGVRSLTLVSGAEVYAEGAFLQNLTFAVKE